MNLLALPRLARSPRAALAAVALLGVVTLGADCDGDVARDPTFRDWCGASLCQWKTDRGAVKPVPTWSQDDLGVSFADDTQISQITMEGSARCLLFTSVANFAPSAQMTLGLDFDADGTFEVTQPIPSATWQKVETEITAPPAYQGIAFRITKGGTGTAVLAEMRIQSTTGCSAAPPLESSLALGEPCSASSQCAAGLVCPPGGDAGVAACSQCDDSAPCSGGAACARRSVFLPLQCAPGQAQGAPGAPCLADDDCESGQCSGAKPVALLADASACDLGAISPSNPGDCSWYEARGGACQ